MNALFRIKLDQADDDKMTLILFSSSSLDKIIEIKVFLATGPDQKYSNHQVLIKN